MSRTLAFITAVSGAAAAIYVTTPSIAMLQATYAGDPVNPSDFVTKYGFPGPASDVASRRAFVSAYDRRTRNPHWTVEHITKYSIENPKADRNGDPFVEDKDIPEMFRARLKDYSKSGYDRGHQVPAADAKWSQEASDETFVLSNMSPQVGPSFNRGYWKNFETFCRRLTSKYPSVRIVTGPLYLPEKDPATGKNYVKYEVIGSPPNVAVPTHFYKIIFAEEDEKSNAAPVAVGAFLLPNAAIDNKKELTEFEVPVGVIERASGLEFGRLLANERRKSLCQELTCSLNIKDFADAASKAKK